MLSSSVILVLSPNCSTSSEPPRVSSLLRYDEELRSILSAITNVHLEADSPSWSQATLPVSYGGLGVRSAVQLSTSAFLASIAASSVLVGQILPSHLHVAPPPLIWLRKRLSGLRTMTTPSPASHHQNLLDSYKVMATSDALLDSNTYQRMMLSSSVILVLSPNCSTSSEPPRVSSLLRYDEELRSILSAITNVHLEADSPSWSQATLPVSYGGLGVRSAVQLSTSAFLASIAASSVLVGQILPSHLHVAPPPLIWLRKRLSGLRTMTTPSPASHHQNLLDSYKVMATSDALLDSNTYQRMMLSSSVILVLSLNCSTSSEPPRVSSLLRYDEELRSILSAITNVHLEADSPSWSQATLPVSYGGLGVRSAVQLSTSAFLASIAASSVLVGQILPSHLHVAPPPLIWLRKRLSGLRTMTTPSPASHHQNLLDSYKVMATSDALLEGAPDARSRARLLAAVSKE